MAKRQTTFQFNFLNLEKKRKGYSKTDICDAVVNKCCPRFNIANLAGSKKEDLISKFSDHYLRNLTQQPYSQELIDGRQVLSKSALEFVVMLKSLSQQILFVARDYNCKI